MFKRQRRIRSSEKIRTLMTDVEFSLKELVYPIFLKEGSGIKEEIDSMPNQFRFSLDKIHDELQELKELGVKNLLLFGITDKKDEFGEESFNKDGIVQRGIRYIRENFPDFLIITDICLCAYTTHGHCGIIENGVIENDKSIEYISKIALSHAEAGADIVAPSDMMDGRIYAIRKLLDINGFVDTPIMSYAIKYASSFYGPFRDAANSAPTGDRKSYQMDFRNSKSHFIEAENDINEGADILMVKPGLAYLDIVRDIKENFSLPVAVYNVSGEYSMVKAAAKNGWINEREIVFENIYAMKRAGANIIITYHTKDIANWIKGDNKYGL